MFPRIGSNSREALRLHGRQGNGGTSAATDDLLPALLAVLAKELDSWKPYVQRLLSFTLRGMLESSDILQDSYLAALKSAETLKSGTALDLGRWFKQIIRNTIRRQLRDNQRLKRSSIVYLNPESLTGGSMGERDCCSVELKALLEPSTPEGMLAMEEDRKRIKEAIEELPPKLSLLLQYVYFTDMPVKEAARKLRIPPDSAYGLLRHAKRKLKEKLRVKGFEG